MAKDITERKRAEEKLVQAKEEWERTFNAIPARIMIVDNQYRIVKVNRAMAHRFGYSPEEMMGKLCYKVVHGSEAPPLFCPYSNGKWKFSSTWKISDRAPICSQVIDSNGKTE